MLALGGSWGTSSKAIWMELWGSNVGIDRVRSLELPPQG